MVKRREKTKREQLHLSVEIFEKRYQARDFSGSVLSELNSSIKSSRYILRNSNRSFIINCVFSFKIILGQHLHQFIQINTHIIHHHPSYHHRHQLVHYQVAVVVVISIIISNIIIIQQHNISIPQYHNQCQVVAVWLVVQINEI